MSFFFQWLVTCIFFILILQPKIISTRRTPVTLVCTASNSKITTCVLESCSLGMSSTCLHSAFFGATSFASRALPRGPYLPLYNNNSILERRQPELVTPILGAKHTEQEAVHAQQNATPKKDGKLLRTRILDPGHLERKGNGGKCQNTVHGSDDLRLEAELVAEASGEVVDAALAVAGYVGGLRM